MSRRGTPLGYALACVAAAVVLTASAFSAYLVRDVASIGGSHAIQSGASTGPQNILLMGLESRTDWNGHVLPGRILKKLHAGSRRAVLYRGVGGNDTNTLILIHIPAGGKRAVGFSIPRDDLVKFAGTVGPQQQGKVDQAYGVSMYYREAQLRRKFPHMSQDRIAFLGNEAGRAAAVATVSKLTGVHIDHFAEVNLAGFYELAKVFGGVEVCLKHAVRDRYSGANFRAGYQHLDAQQALAFVRQRHGLPNGDLDRTHRQQAFIDSILYQLRHQGVMGDLSKLQALISVAKRYVITDSGWNLLDFAAQVRSLTSGHLLFRTLPIERYGTWGSPPQDVNIVNPRYIKQLVHAAFYPPRTRSRHRHHSGSSASHVTVDVYNGTTVYHLAAHVLAALVKGGYRKGTTGNTASRSATGVFYGNGAAAGAKAIAKYFGVTAVARSSVPAGHVHVLLGTGATVPHVRPASSAASPATAVSAPPSSGPQGGTVKAGKKFGIPCVA